MHEWLLSIECYSREYNLRFHNISESPGEACHQKIWDILTEQLKMKPKIENAHRVSLSIADKPRAIICKFIYRPEPGFSKKVAPDDWSPLTLGFIAAYFVFKSLFFSLFCSASLLELFPNFSSVPCTTVIQIKPRNLLTVLDTIDERHFTWVQAFMVKRGHMFQNGGQVSPRGAERTYQYLWLLVKRIEES